MEGTELTKCEEQIFRSLNDFSVLRTLYSLDPIESEHHRSSLVSLLDLIEQYASPESEDLDLIIQIYNILQETDKRLRFSQLFGDGAVNVVLPYNLAYCHQRKGDPRSTLTFLTIAIFELEQLLRVRGDKGDPRDPESIGAGRLLAGMYLQATALCSQIKEHEKALRIARQGLAQISVTIAKLKAAASIGGISHRGKQSGNSNFGTESEEMKRLAAPLGRIAEFAAELAEEPKTEVKNHPLRALEWVHNRDNPIKFLDPRREPTRLRADWLSEFSISDLMFLRLLNLKDFTLSSSPWADEEFIITCVNILAVACFSLATEQRILAAAAQGPAAAGKVGQLSARRRLDSDDRFRQSEYFYVKSVEVLSRFLDDSAILKSLLANYREYYPTSVQQITEEEETSNTVSRLFAEAAAPPRCESTQIDCSESRQDSQGSSYNGSRGTSPTSNLVESARTSNHRDSIRRISPVTNRRDSTRKASPVTDRRDPTRVNRNDSLRASPITNRRDPTRSPTTGADHHDSHRASPLPTFKRRRCPPNAKPSDSPPPPRKTRLGKSAGSTQLRWLGGQLTSLPEADRVHLKSEFAAFFKRRALEKTEDQTQKTFIARPPLRPDSKKIKIAAPPIVLKLASQKRNPSLFKTQQENKNKNSSMICSANRIVPVPPLALDTCFASRPRNKANFSCYESKTLSKKVQCPIFKSPPLSSRPPVSARKVNNVSTQRDRSLLSSPQRERCCLSARKEISGHLLMPQQLRELKSCSPSKLAVIAKKAMIR